MVYLHTSAHPLMQNFANAMVNNQDYENKTLTLLAKPQANRNNFVTCGNTF